MKAMILAAGRGSRMMPLTANTPKPLLEVKGKPLIQHLIEKLVESGITELVINYSYLGDKIEKALGDGGKLGVEIKYSPEETLLGTGGGIVKALPLLGDESFVLVNSDIWTDYSFTKLPVLDGSSSLAHLVVVDNVAHNPEGDFVLGNDALLHIPEGNKKNAFTYSGIAVFHPKFFKDLKVSAIHLLPLLSKAMAKSLISGEYYEGLWVDVGTPERLEKLDSF